MAAPRDPFAMSLTPEQKTAFGHWLGDELTNADAARSANVAEVDYYWTLYEQARTRTNQNVPWPDAADLTSYIPAEKVDAIQARLMRTIMVSPVYTVEGWGEAADRAPLVEEFHQWKVEEERLQKVLDKVSLCALVEPRCLLEVYESSETRTSRKSLVAKPMMTPGGGVQFDEQAQPQLEMGPDGKYLEAKGNELGVKTVVDSTEPVRTGPQYRVLPYADSLILPGHARDDAEVWGYAKRIWKRKRDLVSASQGDNPMYDADAVEKLTDVGDRTGSPSLARALQGIAPQPDADTAEKELWECLVLVDLSALLESIHQAPVRGLSDAGARWYLCTIHQRDNILLRIQHDDFEASRYVNFVLFPRPDRATEGYSFIGHKLMTVAEEHTAYRNMAADRSSLAVNAPIKKVSGALWDEDEQPWGPKAVITVRDHREIEQQVVQDVPASVYTNIDRCERTAERLAGVNDIASGQVAQQDRTLGEIQMATEQSFVRMDLIVRRFQESMEDLGQIRHAIWKRTLADRVIGMDAPQSMMVGLEGRGVSIDQFMPDGKITAALLEGPFRFRPYGSVQTADPQKRRADVMGLMQVIPLLVKTFPFMAQQLLTPKAGRAMMRELLQAFNVRNQQAFMGSPAQDMAAQMQLNALPMPSVFPPPPPMLPPGMPMNGPPQGMGAGMSPPGMPPVPLAQGPQIPQ